MTCAHVTRRKIPPPRNGANKPHTQSKVFSGTNLNSCFHLHRPPVCGPLLSQQKPRYLCLLNSSLPILHIHVMLFKACVILLTIGSAIDRPHTHIILRKCAPAAAPCASAAAPAPRPQPYRPVWGHQLHEALHQQLAIFLNVTF